MKEYLNLKLVYDDSMDDEYGVHIDSLKDLVEGREGLVSVYEQEDNKIKQFLWDKFNGFSISLDNEDELTIMKEFNNLVDEIRGALKESNEKIDELEEDVKLYKNRWMTTISNHLVSDYRKISLYKLILKKYPTYNSFLNRDKSVSHDELNEIIDIFKDVIWFNGSNYESIE